MQKQYAVVDLFAGPGGLAEGFWGYRNRRGERPFGIALSVEMEKSAFKTLRLRNFLRRFAGGFPDEYYHFLNGDESGKGAHPDWAQLYPGEWRRADRETRRLELGRPETADLIHPRIDRLREAGQGETILIGGPPCQAYSLVGRARNLGKEEYVAAKDHRHYLYREYLRILERLKPAAFVMENVKGILSSSVNGSRIFQQVLDDLRGN